MVTFPIQVGERAEKAKPKKLFYLDYFSREIISHLSVIEDSYESIFVNASIFGLGNMYVAGIYRPRNKNKPLTDFTRFITGAMDYTNRFQTVFAGYFYIDFMNNPNMTRNYISMFHQYSFIK